MTEILDRNLAMQFLREKFPQTNYIGISSEPSMDYYPREGINGRVRDVVEYTIHVSDKQVYHGSGESWRQAILKFCGNASPIDCSELLQFLHAPKNQSLIDAAEWVHGELEDRISVKGECEWMDDCIETLAIAIAAEKARIQ